MSKKLSRSTTRQHPLRELTLMRWRIFAREPSTMFWTYGFPLILALALGIAFRNRPPDPVDVAVVRGPGSAQVMAALSAAPELHVRELDAHEAEQAMRTGRAAVLVSPPPNATQATTYRYDPQRPESRLARALVDEALQRAAGQQNARAVTDEKVSEPGARYIDFLIPGLLGFGFMNSGLWGVGFVIVEMRVKKLVKRMIATPMRRSHFLLSFVLMRALFLLGELPILLLFAWAVFHVPIRGSLALLMGLAVLGSLTFAGLGLLVASRATNTQTVGGLVQLMMIPMTMCSGVFFSSSKFPESMQPIIKLLPLTALIDSMRAVMIDGAGVTAVALPAAILVLWAGVAFAVALKIFRWR